MPKSFVVIDFLPHVISYESLLDHRLYACQLWRGYFEFGIAEELEARFNLFRMFLYEVFDIFDVLPFAADVGQAQ